ncbi:hypothetical protein [Clostridium minihomine]|uniref:hypothetical protein n=1 Tax=Clostridium minihomine TaxID=2045012 RepID=UPI000C78F5F2|nr:hypothetical protein [Clostridium minihomine]
MTYRIWDKQSPINGCPADQAMATLGITASDKVYIILDDNGRDWIVQTQANCPHPGATIDESAQNHINAILTERESVAQSKTDRAAESDRLAAVEDAITALTFGEGA